MSFCYSLRRRIVARRSVAIALTICVAATGLPNAVLAEQTADNDHSEIQYNRDIRPILAEYCFACHGTDEHSRAAGLRLDIREEAVDYGAISEDGSDDSEMIFRLHDEDPDVVMPPPETNKVLTDEQKELLARWIDQGAVYQRHWALEPTADVAPPKVDRADWQRNPIDGFVLQRLNEQGMSPAPPADGASLFRRLSFDITGLPPNPEDAAEFVADYDANPDAAVDRWVDRLMASPAWGEHRGRYWLDAARYADTHGMHFDNYREIWPYRDWVIRSINNNQPIDEFYVDQLAGDLLPDPTPDQLIATGFLRCNMTTNEGGTIDEENLALYAADRVQTFSWVFLGLTANCAQCHDHKFDDFSAKDYYSLAAFFRNLETPAKDGNHFTGNSSTIRVPSPDDTHALRQIEQQIATVSARHDSNVQSAKDRAANWAKQADVRDMVQSIADVPEGLDPPAIASNLNIAFGESLLGRYADRASLVPMGNPRFISLGKWGKTGRTGAILGSERDSSLEIFNLPPQTMDQPMSVSFWVRPNTTYVAETLVSRLDPNTKGSGWEIRYRNRSIDLLWYDDQGRVAGHVTSFDMVAPQREWTHVSWVYHPEENPLSSRLFINGKPVRLQLIDDAVKGMPSYGPISQPIRIGNREGYQGFQGRFVDFRFDDRILAPWEIGRLAKIVDVAESVAKLDAAKPDAELDSSLVDYYTQYVDAESSQTARTLATLQADQEVIMNRSPITHVAKEKPGEAKANILMRGEYDNLGEEVIAATPEALHDYPEDAPRNRLGLAQWVIDPDNPLTARVTVNRYWLEIFGKGLVVTPEDFGVTGATPTHPELLDFLARRFVQNGWDMKEFFRDILTSQTYRQSALATPDKIDRDPTNQWFSRGPRFRMDAEMIRDNALTVSGLLSDKMFGPGVKPYQPDHLWDVVGLPDGNTRVYVQDEGDNLYRRTLYSFWKRMAPPPSMETFGAPNRETCTVQRERTNTPLQALVTLNDDQFVEAARVMATDILSETFVAEDDQSQTAASIDQTIEQFGQRLLSREFNDRERQIIADSYHRFRSHYIDHGDDADQLIHVGQYPVITDVDPVTLAAWTMVGNQLLNLDEVLCK